jgi:hypothetical protein
MLDAGPKLTPMIGGASRLQLPLLRDPPPFFAVGAAPRTARRMDEFPTWGVDDANPQVSRSALIRAYSPVRRSGSVTRAARCLN